MSYLDSLPTVNVADQQCKEFRQLLGGIFRHMATLMLTMGVRHDQNQLGIQQGPQSLSYENTKLGRFDIVHLTSMPQREKYCRQPSAFGQHIRPLDSEAIAFPANNWSFIFTSLDTLTISSHPSLTKLQQLGLLYRTSMLSCVSVTLLVSNFACFSQFLSPPFITVVKFGGCIAQQIQQLRKLANSWNKIACFISNVFVV